MLQKRPQRGALLAREIVYLLVRRDAGALHRRGNELLRQKLAERVAKIAVRVLLKIRQQALVELLLVERRLEVKLQPIALFIESAAYAPRTRAPAGRTRRNA